MKRHPWFPLLVLLLVPAPVPAESLSIGPDLVLEFTAPSARWVLTREAPAFLLEETAEHLGHELAEQGRTPDAGAVRQAAVKRLAANEGYLCNPASGACLVIDFSPLRQDETPPSRKAVATSARYAAEGLAEEEGVTELRQSSGKARLAGADSASRIDASFHQHGEPRRFLGIVGFRDPYWFYLYYTDTLKNADDYGEMEGVLQTLVLRRPAPAR
jgi:hypothetical protein